MDPAEYLAFVPLLFYGMALADLLGQWRRFFDRNYFYFPYFLTTIIFTEAAVWNVYLYLEIVNYLEGIRYAQYWLYLIQPILLLLTVSALTPDSEKQDTKSYFKERFSLVYTLAAIFVFSHFLSGFGSIRPLTYTRIVLFVLSVAIAITKKIGLIYLTGVVWFLSLLLRLIYS
jgi:hypothetical protein